MKADVETEIKIRIPGGMDAGDLLTQLGYVAPVPRQFESNTLYDTASRDLKKAESILRLRQTGAQSIVTWKGPHQKGPYKSRPELETTIGSAEMLDRILRHLGFEPVFRYEKYRTEFVHPGSAGGIVTFDETPIGKFLELEGPGDWIDATAKRLGFSTSDYILDSYGRLYLAYCESQGINPAHMVFGD